MKVVEINAVPYGSTGKIARSIASVCLENGIDSYFAHSWTKNKKKSLKEKEILIGGFFSRCIHLFFSKFFNCDGFLSKISTKKFVKRLKEIKPDVLHLHVMHSFFIDLRALLKYASENKIKVVWTFHDCWMLTGGCMHFLMTGCDKYDKGCATCLYKRGFSLLPFPSPEKVYELKREALTSVDDTIIVTPSKWLAGVVKQSNLTKDYPIEVINNGIDLSVFHPLDSDFRKKMGIENKYVVLGVAFGWGKRKGLDIFVELSKILDDRYVIVLVGVDSEQQKTLPSNVIALQRTQNQRQLAEIYSQADVFVNATREDNFPTVNIEALACGTPVITSNAGGSAEMVDEDCGFVVEENKAEEFAKYIIEVCEKGRVSRQSCVNKAQFYDEKERFYDYVRLFKDMERRED